MKFERTIWVGPHRVEVEEWPSNDMKTVEDMGSWNPQTNRIHLMQELPVDRKIEVFLHEVVHAILHGHELREGESLVCALGTGLALFIRQNPDVIREILYAYKEESHGPEQSEYPDTDLHGNAP